MGWVWSILFPVFGKAPGFDDETPDSKNDKHDAAEDAANEKAKSNKAVDMDKNKIEQDAKNREESSN